MSENARWISYMKSGIARRKMINRNLLKERQKDDAMYEGKEKFVTAAYKRKLEADRKWLDEVRERELKGRSSKSSFLTHMIDSRADETEDGKQETTKEAVSVSKEEATPSSKPALVEKTPQVEEEDEFDGFIMAPEEDQIKGNVDSDDAGLIMAPSEARRSKSRSRSRSRSRHHHHRHHHRHFCVFNKYTRVQITF